MSGSRSLGCGERERAKPCEKSGCPKKSLTLSAAAKVSVVSQDAIKRAINQGRLRAVVKTQANRRKYEIVERDLAMFELRQMLESAAAQRRERVANASERRRCIGMSIVSRKEPPK